jgi:hypothetical protein
MHRNHPQRPLRTILEIFVSSAHNTILPEQCHRDRLRDLGSPDPIGSFTTPLNPRHPTVGVTLLADGFPVRHTTERRER